MAGAQQASDDFRRCGLHGFGIQRVAAEQIDFLELREESGTRVAARHALHFVDRQRLTGIDLVGIELVASVEMTRNEQYVAANAFATRGCEPVGTTTLDELDELVLVCGEVAPERLALVG